MKKRILLSLAACSLSACGQSPQPAATAHVLSFSQFAQAEVANPLKPAARPATPSCDALCTLRRQEFRYVAYVGKQIYAYWDQKKAETHTDFDALAQSLEQSIGTSTSVTAYFQVLKRWASAFHDGHVNAIYKSDDSDYEIFTAPVRLEVLAPATDHEKVIVTQIVAARGFSAKQIDLQVGDEVLAVGGKPVRQALDDAEKMTSGSTARMRRTGGVRRLVDIAGAENGAAPLVLKIKSPQNAATREVTLYRSAELSLPPAQGEKDAADTGAEYFNALVLPGSLGYLRIDAFMGSQDSLLIDESMERLASTRGLLIDVRRNGGGDQSGNRLLARLATSTISRYRSSPRMSDYTLAQRPFYFVLDWTPGALFADWREERVEAAPAPLRYGDKPVVLLTGTDCFSACDTFASALKINHLATVVGEPTGGGSGQPLVFELPVSDMGFRYSVVRGMTADGNAIEGVGTAPDTLIERTQAERLTGNDQQLISALQILQRQISERTATVAAAPPVSSGALRGIGAIWAQDETISPSRALDRELRRVSAVDEMVR